MADYQVSERVLCALDRQLAHEGILEECIRELTFHDDDDEDTEVIEDFEGLFGFQAASGTDEDEPASLFDRRH